MIRKCQGEKRSPKIHSWGYPFPSSCLIRFLETAFLSSGSTAIRDQTSISGIRARWFFTDDWVRINLLTGNQRPGCISVSTDHTLPNYARTSRMKNRFFLLCRLRNKEAAAFIHCKQIGHQLSSYCYCGLIRIAPLLENTSIHNCQLFISPGCQFGCFNQYVL
jgi:hypothetical protein